jgi:hypothetical protein
MNKSLIALAVSALLYGAAYRARTLDISIGYRMGAGFAGDVNRMHPASIVPRLQDAVNPVRLFGDPVTLGASNSVRGFIATDTALTKIRGVCVRPSIAQPNTGGLTQVLGGGTPPQGAAPIDILEDGHIMVKCNNVAAGSPVLGGAVFVWVVASAGSDVQGGFRAAASGVNTIAITNAEWASPPDSNGIAELRVWRA